MTHAKNQNFFCKLKIKGKVDVQGVFIRARSVLACSPLSSGNTWMPDPAEQVGMHWCLYAYVCVGTVKGNLIGMGQR